MYAVRIETGATLDEAEVARRVATHLVDSGEVATLEPRRRSPARVDGSPSIASVRLSAADQVELDLPDRDTAELLDMLCDLGFSYTLVVNGDDIDLPVISVGTEIEEAILSIEQVARIDASTLREAIAQTEPRETLTSLVEKIQDHPDSAKAGAIATFTGRVRADNIEGSRTTHLEYEKYDGVADEELAAIRDELVARDGVYEVLLHHRTGVVEAEEDAVYVVVLAGHRPEAFRAVEDGIDLLKERVPIFKKEVTESGDFWAHDRP